MFKITKVYDFLIPKKRKFENNLHKTTKGTHTQHMNTGTFLKTVHILSEIKNFHITYGILKHWEHFSVLLHSDISHSQFSFKILVFFKTYKRTVVFGFI